MVYKSIAAVLLFVVLGSSAVGAAPASDDGGGVAPPSNDLPENATLIEALPFSDTVDTRGATGTEDERPECRQGHALPSIWYRYVAGEDMTLEVSSHETASFETFESGSCEPIATADGYGYEVPVERGKEYLIRLIHLGESATLSVRRFASVRSEFFPDIVARGVGESVVVTGTLHCDRPGRVRFDGDVFQAVDEVGVVLSYSSTMDEWWIDCEGQVPLTVTYRRDSGSGPFVLGPLRVRWVTDTCVADDFRYEGWEDCRVEHGFEELIVAP